MPQIKQFLCPTPPRASPRPRSSSWKVAVGDTVVINQPIVDIETAKSLVELPCPFAGKVVEIHVAEGITADVGTPIISIDVDPDGALPPALPPVTCPSRPPPRSVPRSAAPARRWSRSRRTRASSSPASSAAPRRGRTSVLVGYGPKSQEAKRRPVAAPASSAARAAQPLCRKPSRRTGRSPPVAPAPAAPVAPVPSAPVAGATLRRSARSTSRRPATAPGAGQAAVRKLARDLGVDLASVPPTGPNGTVTRDDVMLLARRPAAAAAAPQPVARPPLVVDAPGERETRTRSRASAR